MRLSELWATSSFLKLFLTLNAKLLSTNQSKIESLNVTESILMLHAAFEPKIIENTSKFCNKFTAKYFWGSFLNELGDICSVHFGHTDGRAKNCGKENEEKMMMMKDTSQERQRNCFQMRQTVPKHQKINCLCFVLFLSDRRRKLVADCLSNLRTTF